jgi:hypothetical protein
VAYKKSETYLTHYIIIQVKHILFVAGVIFSVFFGPDEYLQISEFPAVLWSVISEDLLFPQHQGGYVLLTANKSPVCKEIPPDKVWEKSSTIQLGLLWCEVCRGEGNLRMNFKFDIFYSFSEVT